MSSVNDSSSNATDTISNGSFNCPAKTCLYKTICKEISVARPTRKHLRCDYKLKSRHGTNERSARADIQLRFNAGPGLLEGPQ